MALRARQAAARLQALRRRLRLLGSSAVVFPGTLAFAAATSCLSARSFAALRSAATFWRTSFSSSVAACWRNAAVAARGAKQMRHLPRLWAFQVVPADLAAHVSLQHGHMPQ